MAHYYELLARAVANLPKTSPPSTRRAIYERARKALTNQLRSLKPQLPESDIAREEKALDEAVARLEHEFPPPPPPPPKINSLRSGNLIGRFAEQMRGDFEVHFPAISEPVEAEIPPPSPPLPAEQRLAAFADKPGPIDLKIDQYGMIDVGIKKQIPTSFRRGKPKDLQQLSDACRHSASRLLDDIRKQVFGNFRDTQFVLALDRYLSDLPDTNDRGNILLADDSALELFALGEDFEAVLPDSYIRKSRKLRSRHEELCGYFEDVAARDKAINESGSLPPAPEKQVQKVAAAIQEKGAEFLTPEAQETILKILQPPAVALNQDDLRATSLTGSSRHGENTTLDKRRSYNILTTLAKLRSIATFAKIKDGVGMTAAIYNTIKLMKEYLIPIIDELAKKWPF